MGEQSFRRLSPHLLKCEWFNQRSDKTFGTAEWNLMVFSPKQTQLQMKPACEGARGHETMSQAGVHGSMVLGSLHLA